MSKFLCIRRTREETARRREYDSRVRHLKDLCTENGGNATKVAALRSRALRYLSTILRKSRHDRLAGDRARDLVYCAVSIFSYYEDVSRDGGACSWKRRRDYKMALTRYNDLARALASHEELARSVIETIGVQNLWHREHLCWELSRVLLNRDDQGVALIEALLDRAENSRAENSLDVLRLLYEIFEVYEWPVTPASLANLERLLELYHASLIYPKNATRLNSMRRGLEVCVRNAIRKLDNERILVVIHRICRWLIDDEEMPASDSTVLNFGSILEYAAHAHDTRLYEDTLDTRVFPILMHMIGSDRRLVSLLGNRVFHRLLDRRANRAHFDTPKIFFENTSHEIKVGNYEKQDKNFLRANREILHDSLVQGLMRHCSTRMNLEAVYRTVCLIAVEVPCGFTAAAIVCLVMNVQDLTLQREDMSRYVSYHLHATIMAIMSLLCWIHEARIFYAYVNEIMTRRAVSAPHLNPPIRSNYSFALHHVLWNKPDLFFVDWQVRYGLWKCFRTRDARRDDSDRETRRSD